jgi:hypothetical protein
MEAFSDKVKPNQMMSEEQEQKAANRKSRRAAA